MSEEELYPLISKWLHGFLSGRYRRFKVLVEDTHRKNLSDFIFSKNLHGLFPSYTVFDIKVDITGVILGRDSARLVFVECKIKPIRLLDVGQLLGYSLVAKPAYSFLISPEGFSNPLISLLKNYGRYDILEYTFNGRSRKKLILAAWDQEKRDLVWKGVLPPGIL
jgi:hypothetical protein